MSVKVLRNEILRNSSIYVITSVINASIPFFLLPIMTSCLSPEDYGITAMYQLVISFVMPIIGLNTEGAISIEYYKKENSDFGRYIGNCFILSCISFLLLISVSAIFTSDLSGFTGIPSKWILLALIQSLFQFVSNLLLILWQISKKAFKYGVFQIISSFLNALLSIWLVYYLRQNYEGRLNAGLLSVAILFVYSFIYIIKKYHVKFIIDKSAINDALLYGLPLIPHAIGGWSLALIDRFILAQMVGLDIVGKYSVAFQLATVLSFVTAAVNQAFVPWLFERLVDISYFKKVKIVKLTYIYMVLLIILTIILNLLFPFIQVMFIADKFIGVRPFFEILTWGFCFQGFYLMFTNYITFMKRTKYQAAITLVVAGIKIPITYFLIAQYGPIGAAIAFSSTFFIFFVLTALVSNKIYKMPWILAFKAMK